MRNKKIQVLVVIFLMLMQGNMLCQAQEHTLNLVGEQTLSPLKGDVSFTITRLKLNTADAEFWVGNYGGELFYARSCDRFVNASKECFHRVHFYELKPGAYPGESTQKAPRHGNYFRSIPVDMQSGPVTFSPDNRQMVATAFAYDRLRVTPGETHGSFSGFCTQLFYTTISNNGHRFSPYKLLFPQEANYSYAHPFFIDNGKTLLFASDRPGGYGGFDLYLSRYDKETKTWGNPQNLGSEVNTTGDEIYPVLYQDRLLFASNGLPGFGGYDLFTALFDKGEVQEGSIVHLPAPVNSAHNDYSLYPLSLYTAYFVSDRNPVTRDDLYYLQTNCELGLRGKSSTAVATITEFPESLPPQEPIPSVSTPEGLLLTLYFDFDSADLTSESVERLRYFMLATRGLQFGELMVEGFSDRIGTQDYNYKLSAERARTVSAFLQNYGLQCRFKIRGWGYIGPTNERSKGIFDPVRPTSEGADQMGVDRRDRRVEIHNNRIVYNEKE
ncbi:MAG: OmpA family protein [Bacteroides sp.]